MGRWSRWTGVGAAVGVILALVPVVQGNIGLHGPLAKLQKGAAAAVAAQDAPLLEHLDLMRLDIRPHRVTASLGGGKVAELTLDAELQRAAQMQMQRYRVPEAGIVLMEVSTGKILVYASYVAEGEHFDVNARAEAPAASVFKVVTGAALIEKAGLSPRTEQCYHGGKSQLLATELKDDPQRDKWCATLGIAMGRSLNVVFARLAQKHLTPNDLAAMGGALGFGAPVPFPVPNEAPHIEVPSEPLEFARTAAGFWHTSLSPLAAASLAQTIGNGGVALEPRVVAAVHDGKQKIWEDTGNARVVRRAIKTETARELTEMMVQTVASGSAFKTFHDGQGRPFLPGIAIAGKTGTLTREKENRHYTWFIGFAPANAPEVAVSALVVNTPTWQIKGPHLAREVLRAYFAERGDKDVTLP